MILTNADGADNFAVLEAPVGAPGRANWRPLVAHRPEVRLDNVEAFAGHVVISERERALERLRIITWAGGRPQVIDQPEAAYSLSGSSNPEFASSTVRFGYTSLVTPSSTIEYDVGTGARRIVKQQPVLGGYDPERYVTERLWAPGPRRRRGADLTREPPGRGPRRVGALRALRLRRLRDHHRPDVLIAATQPARARLRVRHRPHPGRRRARPAWYEDGRLLHKTNTFTDFIACAEHLIANGYTSPERLAIRGGSAGGLLMGAVTNLRPDLWRAVIAEVPFVDCLTTMLDDSLPLTITEWEEWGNPVEDQEAYAYIRSYSPVDNLAAGPYPTMYVTGGLNDPRVGFWEPAKWVAKLRATVPTTPPWS